MKIKFNMTTLFQIITFIGIVATAVGGLGYYLYSSEDSKKEHIESLNKADSVLDTVRLAKKDLLENQTKGFESIQNKINNPNEIVKGLKKDTNRSGSSLLNASVEELKPVEKSQVQINQNSGVNYGNVGGVNNTVNNTINNYSAPKPRVVTDYLIQSIEKEIIFPNMPIQIFRRVHDEESLSFSMKIKSALENRGFSQVYIANTIINDQIITGNQDEEIAYQRSVSINVSNDLSGNKYLRVVLPPK